MDPTFAHLMPLPSLHDAAIEAVRLEVADRVRALVAHPDATVRAAVVATDVIATSSGGARVCVVVEVSPDTMAMVRAELAK